MDKLKTIGLAVLGFIFLVGLVVVYYPSLYHVARSDQLSYLSALGLTHDWWSLAINAFDLNRKSWFPGGDAGLFRPVLYFLLGNERYFFEYDYFYWQLTGLVLHVIACILLCRVLWRIQPGIGALCFTGFFAFQFSNLETVIWHHINAYIVFAIFILIALDYFLRWTKDHRISDKIWPLITVLTLACFTYEVGIWYCVCFAVIMRSWRLMLPVVLYALASVSNALVHTHVVGGAPAGWHPFEGVSYFLLTVKWFICAGLFLGPEDLIFAPRLEMRNDFLIWGGTAGAWSLGDILALGMILMLGVAIWRWQRSIKSESTLLTLILMMLTGYILIIVFGRVASRGINAGLSNTIYYLYNFWLLGVVGIVALFKFQERWRVFFLTVLVVLTCYNGVNLYRMNAFMASAFAQERGFVTFIRSFVRSHRAEPDFTFTVSDHCPGHYAQMIPSHDGRAQKKFTFAQLLYPQYYSDQKPKYTVGGQ